MRYIEKTPIKNLKANAQIQLLYDYIEQQIGAEYPLHPDYEDLDTPAAEALEQVLKEEQKGLCCYCMQRLEEFHVEHCNPQSAYTNEELYYYNLFLSCGDNRIKRSHCGQFKKNELIAKIILYKGRRDKCQDFFKYSNSGEILPRGASGTFTDAKNNYNERQTNLETKNLLSIIDTLNLNDNDLKDKRNAIAEAIIDKLPNDLPRLQETLRRYENPGVDGNMESMCEVAIFFLKQKIARLQH